jgi:glutamyl-tRNA synthetase
MKDNEVSNLLSALSSPDFKAIEPYLVQLNKHLTLRSYVEGYTISDTDTIIWIALRSNRITNAFIKRGMLANLYRWFTFIENTHPEIQTEIKVQDDAVRAKKAAASKAGASYNLALQDVGKGVVTRFPPEPSYELFLFILLLS